MDNETTSAAVRRFVDYFGELGPRWGLPADACRVHAYLYVVAGPVDEKRLAAVCGLDQRALDDALAFLSDHRMADQGPPRTWRTGSDPWEMLLAGLKERRDRELPEALLTLRQCRAEALKESPTERRIVNQVGKMLDLVESLGALDFQMRRLPPGLLKGIISISGRAARIMDTPFGSRRRPL